MAKKLRQKKENITQPARHHSWLRALLIIFAVFIFGFNTIVKVDVSAQKGSSAISSENLLKGHNDYRKSQGLSELSLNNQLSISAQKKAEVLLQTNCWSHFCPPGKSPWDFFEDADYDYVFAGENLAEGFYNVEDVMKAWVNSTTHRENIVKKEYTEIGFGILSGDYQNNKNNIIIVVHFGSRPPQVVLANSKTIKITNPVDGSIITESITDITGDVSGFNRINIISNNILQGEASISNGIFTYRLNNLADGEIEVYADGVSPEVTLSSNKVKLTVQTSGAGNFITTSSQTKNMANLVFASTLALIFLVDFLIVSRTQAIKNFKSFSHYHFIIFIVVGVVIVVGGFAGQIGTSLAS